MKENVPGIKCFAADPPGASMFAYYTKVREMKSSSHTSFEAALTALLLSQYPHALSVCLTATNRCGVLYSDVDSLSSLFGARILVCGDSEEA